MSIAETIREALRPVAPGGLTLDQLHDKTGLAPKQLNNNLWAFKGRGEIEVKADKEGIARYHLNADFTSGRAAPKNFADLLERTKVEAPAGARQITGAASVDDAPAQQPKEEPPMPSGIYKRTKKDAPPPAAKAEPKKRGGKPKKKAAADMGALATEALIAAARHLAATVRECVDMKDVPELSRAMASHELAEKIHEAATA